MFKLKFFILLIFGIWMIPINAASIKGKLLLDGTWAPILYVSVIHSFDELHTASYDFLRYKIELDSLGYFEVNNMELAEGDLIYRLHICKTGDPESSIFIGGKDENFIHFIMNNNSEVNLVQEIPFQGIKSCLVTGHSSGPSLLHIFKLQEKLETPPSLPSKNNRAFIKVQVLDGLKEIIDTSSNELIQLLALHYMNESFTNEDHLGLMDLMQKNFINSAYSSPYYDSFVKDLNYMRFQAGQTSYTKNAKILWVGLPILLLFLGIVFRKEFIPLFGKGKQKINSLSIQEKRVFNLLKKGKSNKEISSELHIEVSTVKSHLHRIYTRLGVKSRKELVEKN